MDKAKISSTETTDAPNEAAKTENKTKYSNILTQEVDTLSTNQLSRVDFLPKFKENSKERKDPDGYLKKDKGLHEKRIPDTSKEGISQKHDVLSRNHETYTAFWPKFKPIRKGKTGNRKEHTEVKSLQSERNSDENAKDNKQEDADIFSEKKVNYFRNVLSKYLREALANPFRIIRNILFFRYKGKMPTTLESKSDKILEKEKYISQMDRSKSLSNEKSVSRVELETLEDLRTEIVNNGKIEMRPDEFAKLKMQSKTSTKSKDETQSLSSTNSESEMQNNSETRTQSSEVRSAEDVLRHFRCFMQSRTKCVDRSKSEDNNKEDTTLLTESETCHLDDLTKTPTESTSQNLGHSAKTDQNPEIQNLKDPAKEKMESVMTENSRKAISEVPETQIDNSKNLIKTTKGIPRQRTVYDEKIEYVRGWILQCIKDRGTLLKLSIKEGNYSDDIETKMRCIEEAEDLQDETEELFDELEVCEKMENIPQGFITQDDYSISPTPKKRNLKWPERQLKSLLDLLKYLHKFSIFESNNDSVYQRIHRLVLRMDYDIYLGTKEKRDRECKIIENIGRNVVDKFYLELLRFRPKVKGEISHTEARSSEDDINDVYDLIFAAKENLTCLQTLIPQVSSMIAPLYSYLAQSLKNFSMTYSFLKVERSDIFLDSSDNDTIFV